MGAFITSLSKECRARPFQDWFSNSGKSWEPKLFPTLSSAILSVWTLSVFRIAGWLLPFQSSCSYTTEVEREDLRLFSCIFFFFKSYRTFYPWRISLLPHYPALGHWPLLVLEEAGKVKCPSFLTFIIGHRSWQETRKERGMALRWLPKCLPLGEACLVTSFGYCE